MFSGIIVVILRWIGTTQGRFDGPDAVIRVFAIAAEAGSVLSDPGFHQMAGTDNDGLVEKGCLGHQVAAERKVPVGGKKNIAGLDNGVELTFVRNSLEMKKTIFQKCLF